jgi:drug/metabolite transporter (DMT)-like permease
MSTSRHHLHWLGIFGLVAGLLLVGIASIFVGELTAMLRGYGLLLTGSAVYLLGGLWFVAWRRAAGTQRAAVTSVTKDLVRQS